MFTAFNDYLETVIASTSMLLLISCSSHNPEIETVCYKDSVGNYVIKWETSPKMKGSVQLFESNDPNIDKPVFFANVRIGDGVTTYITHDNFARKYFRLVFNNTYNKTVSSREIAMDSVSSIRDFGGYPAPEGKNTRWGKVFRAGDVSNMGDRDYIYFDNLKIKTIIDLRMDGEATSDPIIYPKAQIISIPVVTPINYAIKQVIDGKFRRRDVSLLMEDMFLQFTDNKRPFTQALAMFMDEINYPILIVDSQGKDSGGFLSALLLSALRVSEDVILTDYVSANEGFNPKQYTSLTNSIDDDKQEAITLALSSRKDFLNAALNKIKRENGSVYNYLKNELSFSEKQMEQLGRILLY